MNRSLAAIDRSPNRAGHEGQQGTSDHQAANPPGQAAALPPHIHQPPRLDSFESSALPPFWSDRPGSWFTAIECQFAGKRIASDTTKFYSVLGRLDKEQFIAVENLANNPPAADKYQTLKEALLNQFTDSQEKRFRKLVSELELGHQRPSAFLAEIRRLGGNNLDAKFVKTLWTDRLPREIQMALVAADGLQLDELAVLADRITEIPYSDTTRHHMMPVSSDDRVGKLEDAINNLSAKVTELSSQMALLRDNVSRQSHRGRSRSRRGRSATPSTTVGNRGGNLPTALPACYYHQRFKEKAEKCTSPCGWSVQQGNEQLHQ